jgi:hypothetical protein
MSKDDEDRLFDLIALIRDVLSAMCDRVDALEQRMNHVSNNVRPFRIRVENDDYD